MGVSWKLPRPGSGLHRHKQSKCAKSVTRSRTNGVPRATGDVMSRRKPMLVTFLGFCLLGGCSSFGGPSKPDWVDGTSQKFPPGQYLVGVGQSDTRAVSEDQAYAAVARVFKSEISARSKDLESYLVVEQRGQSRDERRL